MIDVQFAEFATNRQLVTVNLKEELSAKSQAGWTRRNSGLIFKTP
jgi:hypothetical protein